MQLFRQNPIVYIIILIVLFVIFNYFYKNLNRYDKNDANVMVFFDFNKYELNQQNIMTLQQFFSNRNKQYNNIIIIGHADHVGSEKTNLRFGYLRSLDVMQWLNQIGVNAAEFTIISKGYSDPVGSDPKLNRSVEIHLS